MEYILITNVTNEKANSIKVSASSSKKSTSTILALAFSVTFGNNFRYTEKLIFLLFVVSQVEE